MRHRRRAAALLAALALVGSACRGTEPAASAPAVDTAPTFAPTPPTFSPPLPTFAPADGPADTSASDGGAPPASGAPAGDGELLELVATLPVAPEGSRDTYDRDLFGGAWTSRGGCDTRCQVLARDRRDDLPGLPHGGWLSTYDGYTTDDPTELDIDHVVPLAEAWRSGAAAWDGNRRIAFANDVTDGALVAVTAATNRAKGDRDPAGWQPPRTAAWCDYVAGWTTTKLRWGLHADEAEVRALTNMAASQGCR